MIAQKPKGKRRPAAPKAKPVISEPAPAEIVVSRPTNAEIRDKVKQLYHDITSHDRDDIIRRVERACWNTAIIKTQAMGLVNNVRDPTFLQVYSDENYRLICLLKSTVILEKLRDPAVANNVCNISSEMLAPDLFQELRDDINMRQNQQVEQKTSSAYECKKCKNRRTTFLQFQSRSLDEESKQSIKCMVCQHVWGK